MTKVCIAKATLGTATKQLPLKLLNLSYSKANKSKANSYSG